MTGSIQNIIQHLFHQPSLQSVTVEEVQRMAERHPSFAVAQYLLLRKMQETTHPGFTDQLQKTTLYFHNPLWLSYLLQLEPETVEAFDAFTTAGPTPADMATAGGPEIEPETAAPAPGEETMPVAPADEAVPGEKAETLAWRKPGGFAANQELPVIIETPFAQADTLFEPYHTIDYFASQGIKLERVDSNPQDKLGRQLKSFTEWLRSMKKLPQAAIEKELAKQDESEVLDAAAHSIEKKEVLTETMAEVYEKQGLTEKAADIYRKLSLLNPSKTAYFAAKIEALNKQ